MLVRMPRTTPAMLAVCLYACGGGLVETTTDETAEATPIVAHVEVIIASANGYRVEGTSVWEGRYDCAQGITGLTLELVGSGGVEVRATFNFYAVPENPSVPSGSYTLTGAVRSDGTIELVPERWLSRPAGYEMVGMSGRLDHATGIMRGAIPFPSCTAFDLHRVR